MCGLPLLPQPLLPLPEIDVAGLHSQVLFYVCEALAQQIEIPQMMAGYHDVCTGGLQSGYEESYPVEHRVLPECLVQAPAPFVLCLCADQDVKVFVMGIAVM